MKSFVASICLLLSSLSYLADAAKGDLEHMKPHQEYQPPPSTYSINKDYFNADGSRRNLRQLQARCLNEFEMWTEDGCNYDALAAQIQTRLSQVGCGHDVMTELKLIYNTNNENRVYNKITTMCSNAQEAKQEADSVSFSEITEEGNDVFVKAYFDGGTPFNEERETMDSAGLITDQQYAGPNNRIVATYYQKARYNSGISFPNITNFQNCDLRAVMCCWTQDRQADDDNGNCATPYDENCVDADPADNTDVCYVDMERSPTSNRVTDGFAVYEDEQEGDAHCHGFAWADDVNDPSAVYKGVNLFYVSAYDHLSQRGYARNVPGSPMCGCVEQMAVVSRSDCTEIVLESEWTGYSLVAGKNKITARITYTQVDFQACQGANNNNNDLSAYYQQLVNEQKATQAEKDQLDQYIVGDNQCGAAITSFMAGQGWSRA